MKETSLSAAFLLFGLAWAATAAAAAAEPGAEYRKITAEAARRLMRETASFVLLDVRSEAERRETRIPGSKLLPDREIAARAGTELPDRNMPVLVYCRSGRRSEAAARTLVGLGYTRVYDMGGIVDWPYEKE